MYSFVLAGAIGIATASPAIGAPQSDDVTFSASDFTAAFGGTPASTVSGSFSLTFDPTQTYTDSSTVIALTSLSGITLDYPLSFDYNSGSTTESIPEANGVTVSVAPGELIVGGSANGAGAVQYNPSTNDFYLQISNFTTAPKIAQLGYTQTSVSSENLFYTTASSTTSLSVSPVPEPSTYWMMLAGVATAGLMLWRRERRGGASLALA